MRIAPLALCACLGAASAAYCQDGKATQPGAAERVRLEKCFADMLAVAKRHGLSDRAGSLLEAGCDREMETYKTARLPDLTADWQRTRSYAPDDVTLQSLANGSVASIKESLVHRYKNDPVSFCTGDSCAVDAYRKCLLLQVQDELPKGTIARSFDAAVQEKCRASERAARVGLMIDFETAQKLQAVPGVGDRTRNLIEQAIKEVREQIVVTYYVALRKAEELAKAQSPGKTEPKRKSCRVPDGDESAHGDAAMNLAYRCAVGEISP